VVDALCPPQHAVMMMMVVDCGGGGGGGRDEELTIVRRLYVDYKKTRTRWSSTATANCNHGTNNDRHGFIVEKFKMPSFFYIENGIFKCDDLMVLPDIFILYIYYFDNHEGE
jgi:hypothetical protein